MTEFEHYKTRKPLKAIDLVVLLVGLVFFILCIFFMLPNKGNSATIYVEGQATGTYSLSINRVIHVGNMVIKIENNQICVEYSDCSNKICEKTGYISEARHIIVCSPNRVVIVINGKSEIDAIIGETP